MTFAIAKHEYLEHNLLRMSVQAGVKRPELIPLNDINRSPELVCRDKLDNGNDLDAPIAVLLPTLGKRWEKMTRNCYTQRHNCICIHFAPLLFSHVSYSTFIFYFIQIRTF